MFILTSELNFKLLKISWKWFSKSFWSKRRSPVFGPFYPCKCFQDFTEFICISRQHFSISKDCKRLKLDWTFKHCLQPNLHSSTLPFIIMYNTPTTPFPPNLVHPFPQHHFSDPHHPPHCHPTNIKSHHATAAILGTIGQERVTRTLENAFILFCHKCCKDWQATLEEALSPSEKQHQADLSKTISQQWKSLSAHEQQYWEQLAKEKKKEHELKYSNYVYRPQRTKNKDNWPKSRKHKQGNIEKEVDNITIAVPNIHPQCHHGWSLSANPSSLPDDPDPKHLPNDTIMPHFPLLALHDQSVIISPWLHWGPSEPVQLYP